MTIAETGKRYGLSPDTLRYYEKIGLIPPVRRSGSGIRDYSETDCRWVEFVKCMRGAGIPVDVLIEYVSLFQKGDSSRGRRKAILSEQRQKLAERISGLRETLEKLNAKIARYDTVLYRAEKNLLPGSFPKLG